MSLSMIKVINGVPPKFLCSQNIDGNTALHMAVAAHRSEAVNLLLKADTVPTASNHNNFTPILGRLVVYIKCQFI